MEDSDLLDRFPEGNANQSIQMFGISLTLSFIAFLIILLDQTIGLPLSRIIILPPVLILTSFVISITGLSIGASEQKYSTNQVKTGIIGNALLIGLQVAYVVYLIFWW